MTCDRRSIVTGLATGLSLVTMLGGVAAPAHAQGRMYGMIGRIRALPGRRAELAELMLAGSGAMPGCLSYIVAQDAADPDTLWVSEAWDSKESHRASLSLPWVRETITKARPLIATFDTAAETVPLGGMGLSSR